jgi:hypothetical protein
MAQHDHCFGFEADFVADLRCLPMAVRRKLDLAGVKLGLQQWNALSAPERSRLLAWADDPSGIEELRRWLLARTAELPGGPARTMPAAAETSWQRGDTPPDELMRSCAELGLSWCPERWPVLDELQRFALVKLSHPGHEHRNLPRALAEFGLLR